MYNTSSYVHFSYEQKFVFVRNLTYAVHKQMEERSCAKTFEYNGMRSKVIIIIPIW